MPPQRTPLSWALPPMHPAALAHQAVKDRLAGKCNVLEWMDEVVFLYVMYLIIHLNKYIPRYKERLCLFIMSLRGRHRITKYDNSQEQR